MASESRSFGEVMADRRAKMAKWAGEKPAAPVAKKKVGKKKAAKPSA